VKFSAAKYKAAAYTWEVCVHLEGVAPYCLICLICLIYFIAFVSYFVLIFFSFRLELGFWTWHIDADGAFLLRPVFFCAVG
jgi:hypothetical protein